LALAKVEVSCTSWLFGQPNHHVHRVYEQGKLTHTLLGDRIMSLRAVYTNGMREIMKYWRKALDQGKAKPSHGQIEILKDRCKGCRFCIEFCPRQVLEESIEFNRKGYHPVYAARSNDCVNCGLCELICPEFAIRVAPTEEEEVKVEECHA